MKLIVLPFVASTVVPVTKMTGSGAVAQDEYGPVLPDQLSSGPSELEHAGLARGLAIETARILSDWPGLRIVGPFHPAVNLPEEAEVVSDDPLKLSPDNPFYIPESAIVEETESYLQGRLLAEPGGWRLTLRVADPFDDDVMAMADCTGARDGLAELLLHALNEMAEQILPPLANVIPRLATLDSDALTAYCRALDAVVQLEESKEPKARRAYLEMTIADLERALEADSGMKYAKILLEAICQLYWDRDILPEKQLAGLLGSLVHQGEATPALMRFYGVLKLEMGDARGAAGQLRRALRAGDNRELCAFYLARAAEVREDWIAAAGWSRVLLQASPGNPAYLALAGKAAHKLEKPDEAFRYWNRALEEDGDLWQVRCGLAVVELEHGDPEAALETLAPALPSDPPPWPVFKLSVIAAHQAEKPDHSEVLLLEAAERCQFLPEEMLEAAHLSLEIGKEKHATYFAETLFHLQPDSDYGDSAARLVAAIRETDFEENLKIGAAAIASKRSREVLEKLRGLAERHPLVWQTKYLLASALWECGDLKGAENTLNSALENRPSAADLHYRLSSLLLERRLLKESEACARRGIACGPEREPQGYGHLAMALGYQGRWKEAREAAREAGGDARASAIRVLVEWMRQQQLRGEEAPLPKLGRISMTRKGDEVTFTPGDGEEPEEAKSWWRQRLEEIQNFMTDPFGRKK